MTCCDCTREAATVNLSGHALCGPHAFREAVRGVVALVALGDANADAFAAEEVRNVLRFA